MHLKPPTPNRPTRHKTKTRPDLLTVATFLVAVLSFIVVILDVTVWRP
jgi:hypothetical protein